MTRRIKGFAGFEDAEGDVYEFAHHGADDEFRGLAGSGKALSEALSQAVLYKVAMAGMYKALRRKAWPILESRGLP